VLLVASRPESFGQYFWQSGIEVLVKIAVVALGKIGLPLAVQFATKGHQVVGADISDRIVDLVGKGEAPFPGEDGLQDQLKTVVQSGHLRATTVTASAVASADAVVIAVPLFVDGEGSPDFTWLDDATCAIGGAMRRGTLVSYETTLPVGTTRTRWLPMLEETSGLCAGEDFHLVFSPERVLTGRVFRDLRRYPKLLGGTCRASASRGVAFYESVLDFDDRPDLARANGVWNLGSAEAAEMAKLAETTYRDVNIGLANQFARFAADSGIDIHAVIEASNSQPFSHLHQPGIAVGGHCIPIYPRLYLWNDPAASIVSAARDANAGMPEYCVGMLEQALGSLRGLRVVVLGAAYRGGVKETAFSGVFPVLQALERRGALTSVHDPLYDDEELRGLGFRPHHLGEQVDAAVVQADHDEYRALGLQDLPGVRAVLDGRRVTTAERLPGVRRILVGVAD
jgi:nucleotide sugar dehydrogenase